MIILTPYLSRKSVITVSTIIKNIPFPTLFRRKKNLPDTSAQKVPHSRENRNMRPLAIPPQTHRHTDTHTQTHTHTHTHTGVARIFQQGGGPKRGSEATERGEGVGGGVSPPTVGRFF